MPMPSSTLAPVMRHVRNLAGADLGKSDADLLDRFVRLQDADAFSVLVRRHGPMVMGLCRRILADNHDADDAFQATFILLVRKARNLKQPHLLGNWLFGVARRVAQKAKVRSKLSANPRLSLHERCAVNGVSTADNGILEILDDAIERLPAKYRVPIVLCYLQGYSHAETAQRLGCAIGTIATRLSRAKARLRASLIRQGVTPAIAATVLDLSSDALSAAVPATLLVGIRSAATAMATGVATTAVPVSVLALTKGIGGSMILQSWKAVCIAVATILATGATGWSLALAPAIETPPSPETAPSTLAAGAVSEWTNPSAAPIPDDPANPREDHPPKPHVLRTDNFIVTGPSARTVRIIGTAAEDWRKKHALQWLRKELPPWSRPCPIELKIDGDGSSSSTTIKFDFQGGTELVSMNLQGSLERILANALPHEVTHAVLATHFAKPIPRWADEGAALLAEDDDERKRHDQSMRDFLRKKAHLPLRRLLTLREYGEASNVMVVFAQGCSVVRFLVERKDKPTFLRFVDRGMNEGWDTAAKNIYSVETVEKLEEAWLKDLEDRKKGDGGAQPIREGEPPRTPPNASVANSEMPYDKSPHVVRAWIDEEGRLVTKSSAATIEQVRGAENNPTPPQPIGPRPTATRRYSVLEVRGCLVKGQRLEEIDLQKLAAHLSRETAVIAMVVDGPREELDLLLRIVKDDTIVLLLPLARKPGPALSPSPTRAGESPPSR